MQACASICRKDDQKRKRNNKKPALYGYNNTFGYVRKSY